MKLKSIFLPLMALAITAPALAKANASTPQDKICIYTDVIEGQNCKAGELSYYKPSRWGNDQLPTNIAARFCNTNYRILATNAGVLCTHSNRAVIYQLSIMKISQQKQQKRELAAKNKRELAAKNKRELADLDDLI